MYYICVCVGVVTRSCIEGPEWVDGSAKCFNETTDLLNQVNCQACTYTHVT